MSEQTERTDVCEVLAESGDVLAPAVQKAVLRRELDAARRHTLRLLEVMDQVDPGLWSSAVHPDYSPIGWHIGHVAVFAGIWILQRLGGQAPIDPGFDVCFMPDKNPKPRRGELPPRGAVLAFAEETARRVGDVLEATELGSDKPLEHGGVLFWQVIQHEQQHGETIAVILHLKRRTDGFDPFVSGWGAQASSFMETPRIEVPSGELTQGSNAIWGYDNERPEFQLKVAPFRIDQYPVTNGQFLAFVLDGGYTRREFWSERGWAYRKQARLEAPGAWTPHLDGGWFTWGLGQPRAIEATAPVSGVSWFEAEAYGRWRGLALPTESEWEWVASWGPDGKRRFPWGDRLAGGPEAACALELSGPAPVEAHPAGASALGCLDLAGNVWEWTESWFEPYPGFRSFPYAEYSMPWFGDHKVLRGGSWATSPLILRTTFRNWYVPTCRTIFAGFRCVERE